ncbi:MAG TPA: hypothetical protein VNV42_14880 [Solirubrobacteraceae bacterium]|jgi:hypothetical protein|nr:hypothetical protein [Solirubrobacteraceae bacterium]
MLRSKLIGVVGTVAVAALSGAGAATADTGSGTGAGAAPGATPTLSATVEQCVTAATPTGRSVTFAGQMETVAGAHEMAIQIVVQQRLPEEETFHTLTSGGLGAWQHSEPGVSIYKVRQAVTDLPAPAFYRAIVRYRWLDERGQVIRRDKRRTPVCRQPPERHRPGAGSTATMPKA